MHVNLAYTKPCTPAVRPLSSITSLGFCDVAYRHVLVSAVGRRKRDAIEVHAVVTVADGRQVEDHHQDGEQGDGEQQTHGDADESTNVRHGRATHRQVGAKPETHEYAEQQAEEMSEVVNVRQDHAEEEEDAEDDEEFGDRGARGSVFVPAQHLDEHDGQHGELGPRRTGLAHNANNIVKSLT